MALSLNLTLVVQMVHFLGAYFFISRYFLKPGYAAVKEDEERAHHIRSSIIHQQKTIAERNLYKYEQWKLCQEQFMRGRPVIEETRLVERSSSYLEPSVMPSLEEIQRTVKEVSAVLKERGLNA